MIYLDNAATTSPKPLSVARNVYKAILLYSANPGRGSHEMAMNAAKVVYKCRKKVADFFGIDDAERCVFTGNCTQSVNTVLKGSLKAGDHLIISDLEHNAVVRPAYSLMKTGVEVSVIKVENDDEVTLESIRARIKKNTKLIFMTHASNVTGRRLPVERISSLANDCGISFGIDAAQSAGVLELDNRRLKADYFCLPAHKGLYGPMGCGVLILGEKAELRPLIEGGTGSYSRLPYQPSQLPEALESGTQNVYGIVGTAAGIDFVNKMGIKKIFDHELSLCASLEKQLERIPGIVIRSERDAEKRVPITSFTIDEVDSEDVAMKLSELGFAVRGGLHCAPFAHEKLGTIDCGAVRVSPSVFNTEKDIASFVRAVRYISDCKEC